MAEIRAFGGVSPRIDASVFLATGSVVVGDVELGAGASVWFGAVVRGDVNFIRVGARTNIQDLAVIHVTGGTHPTRIGEDVTIGHQAVLHGCTVKDRCLIGIGAIVLDGAVVGEEAIVGAGALVPPGMVVPPRSLVMGTPARVRRTLTGADVEGLLASASHYVEYAARYLAEGRAT
jgi:carbonic anhydrase/acetyltransferase-like protein (isoleucine patch superfamily)